MSSRHIVILLCIGSLLTLGSVHAQGRLPFYLFQDAAAGLLSRVIEFFSAPENCSLINEPEKESGWTLLDFACVFEKRPQMIKYLLLHGAIPTPTALSEMHRTNTHELGEVKALMDIASHVHGKNMQMLAGMIALDGRHIITNH